MGKNKAYLVLGAESSGTRILTQQLIAVGCYGDGDHIQRLDTAVPDNEPLIVWRRSLPYGEGHKWPDLIGMIKELHTAGYEVRAVVVNRDWHCTAISQQGQHTTDVGEALANIRRAYLEIFTALAKTKTRYELTSYEALVTHPQSMTYLLRRLGLPETPLVKLYDGNKRYYQ